MSATVRLDVEGPVAVVTNDRPGRHNAFDDDMDRRLCAVLDEVAGRDDVRVVVWRGEGPSFSSGRDVAMVEGRPRDVSHHELVRRAQGCARRLLDLPVPVVVAVHGWAIGVSFQRALLCDIRIAAEGARFRLPETTYGFIPDAGGMARLYQMCGHGVAADLVLSGRVMEADEALACGVVSRVVAPESLDEVAHETAEQIAATPAVTVASARRVLAHLGSAQVAASMDEEMIAQTFIVGSDDFAEMRSARAEGRPPVYRNT